MGMGVTGWGHTDVGRKRRHNEDSFLCDPDLGLFVVADGMGGHKAGDIASATCVKIVQEVIVKEHALVKAFAENPEGDGGERVQALVEKAVQKACRDIFQMSESEESKSGMGTTCVVFIACGTKAVIGHVGDSRAYLLRQNRVHQLTEDHSLIEEQIKRGLLTRAQAEKSENRNVITRAVGIQPSVEVDTLVTEFQQGDVFLLCSDGLHGYFLDNETPQLLGYQPTSALPKKLIDLANNRGGKDNITAVLICPEATKPGEEVADVDAKAEILRRIPLFQYMNYKELIALLAISKSRRYAPGDILIREGEMSDELFVLFRGQVEVFKGETTLATLKTGGHFGEMGLVDMAPRSASVRAVEPTSSIALGREALLKLMRKDSLLAVKLLWSFVQVLADRLRNANEGMGKLRAEIERLRAEVAIEEIHEIEEDHEIQEVHEIDEELESLPPPPFGKQSE